MNDLVALSDVLVKFTGADALSWLQGQVSNDVLSDSDENEIEACFCSPTGHVLTTTRIWKRPDGVYMAVPKLGCDRVLERVEKFVIMEDCQATPVPLFGYHSFQEGHECESLPCNRFGNLGRDLWLNAPVEARDEEDWEYERIAAGIPRMGKDIGTKTLLPELGSSFMARNVSHSKGCYVGQEVIHRIKAQGHTNRTWMKLGSSAPLSEQADIFNASGELVGKATSSAEKNGKWIAAGMIRNSAWETGEKLWCAETMVEAQEF